MLKMTVRKRSFEAPFLNFFGTDGTVDLIFKNGERVNGFDVVIGADGTHS
jgi:hypothetical protein